MEPDRRHRASPGLRALRTRRCAGIEQVLLPLDDRLRTVSVLLSPRRWRGIERILSGTELLTLRPRARLLRRLLLPRHGDERTEVTLPAEIAGFDLARRGPRGLRLFDFSRRSVTLFAFDDGQFERELRGVELASRLGIGARLIDHDADGPWFREELLSGLDLWGRNREQVELEPEGAVRLTRELLVPLWSAEPPRPVPTRELADRLLAEIVADLGEEAAERGGDPRHQLAQRLRDEVVSLPEAADATVPLVWSHGAMNSSSMVEVDGRLLLVDWENTDRRPATSDAWHAVARWYRRRASVDATDVPRALGFMEAVRSELLESGLEWREEIARGLEPTAHNLRIWALAALRKRVRRDVQRRGSDGSSPQTDLWLEAIDGMLRIAPDAGGVRPSAR